MSIPPAAAHSVCRLLFSKPRAYTTATLGGLDLVLELLRANGHARQCNQLGEALVPLVDACGAQGVRGLPEALATPGRPARRVTDNLRTDAIEGALRSGFQALGWDDLLPCLSAWSPSANNAADVDLDPVLAIDRRRTVLALAQRVQDFLAAWDASGQRWDVAVPAVSGRSARGAARTLAIPVAGLAEVGSSAQASRYGNRVGRLLTLVSMAHLRQALACLHIPEDTLRQVFCAFAVVAEAVSHDVDATGGKRLSIPVGSPVRLADWLPVVWWPILDAWGAPTKAGQASLATSWRLAPSEMDPLVWMLSWATSWVLAAAEAPDRRLDRAEWEDYVITSVDYSKQPTMAGVWDLYQSTRAVPARVPFPGESTFRLVDFTNVATLPWALGSDAEVSA
jgi:hypothetical protein